MPIPTLITDLSQTAGSNYPAGSDSPSVLDDVQRAHAGFIAQLRDGKGNTNPVTLASATTTDIGGQNSMFVEISGTTTITSLGANYNGPRYLRFTGILTLTYNATTININGGASVITSANDTAIAIPNSTLNGWNIQFFQWATSTLFVPSVRQTVLSGAVDSNGLPSFGGSTGSTTVTTSTTLIATAANGTVNRTGTITNPSWTSLSTNGSMFLYLDIAADGTCTTGSTTLVPTYRWGGADVVANTQFTFNIQEMSGKVGNGSTASQVYRVFVGEVTVASNVVSAIVWYALMGRYQSGYTNTLPGGSSSVSRNHNIGTTLVKTQLRVKCLTAQNSYVVDEVETAPWRQSGASNSSVIVPTVQTRLAMRFSTGNSLAIGGFDPTNGGAFLMTAANWAYELTAERNW